MDAGESLNLEAWASVPDQRRSSDGKQLSEDSELAALRAQARLAEEERERLRQQLEQAPSESIALKELERLNRSSPERAPVDNDDEAEAELARERARLARAASVPQTPAKLGEDDLLAIEDDDDSDSEGFVLGFQ